MVQSGENKSVEWLNEVLLNKYTRIFFKLPVVQGGPERSRQSNLAELTVEGGRKKALLERYFITKINYHLKI